MIERKCVKCGNNDTTLKYFAEGHIFPFKPDSHFNEFIEQTETIYGDGSWVMTRDMLECVCRQCGYKWSEETMDA